MESGVTFAGLGGSGTFGVGGIWDSREYYGRYGRQVRWVLELLVGVEFTGGVILDWVTNYVRG